MQDQKGETEIIGYRTEVCGGSENRELKVVCSFEINELENEDIPDTLIALDLISSSSETVGFLDNLVERGYTECVWLCKKIGSVRNYYLDLVPVGEQDSCIDMYVIGEGTVISDLGEPDGFLVAYKPESLKWSCMS